MPLALPVFALLLAVVTGVASAAGRLDPADVPAPLAPWTGWVLHDQPEVRCPLLGADGVAACTFAGPLELVLDAAGGRFAVEVERYGPGWVSLPGGQGQWPQDVRLYDSPLAVGEHAGRPAVYLPAGRHRLAGRFAWPRLPDMLELPPELARVSLAVDGAPPRVLWPPVDGRLRLAAAEPAAQDGERLEIAAFRYIDDALPQQVETRLELDVAGAEREVALRGALLPGFEPMALVSALPARLEADGLLRVLVRPGRSTLALRARRLEPGEALDLPAAPAPWPAEEVWAFAAHTDLRLVDVEGAQAIDPRQTRLPPEWQALPAWRVVAGQGLRFVERRRGDPQPEPDQLSLARELWLDFDGAGYTVRDRLDGRMSRGWRLDAGPGLDLGRVLLDGAAQFITRASADGAPGVEVRRGSIALEAEARLARGALPAVGWDTDVGSLAATLHLPPGWRLWAARGVDNVPDTWLQRWTLLDLFLVLVAAVATARLWGWRAGLLVLAGLALAWHESGAPRQVWLHLLAAAALLRVLPAGRVRWGVALYRNGAFLVLAAIAVAFMIDQVRLGLYPQLAQPWTMVGGPAAVAVAAPDPAVALSEADYVADVANESMAAAGRAVGKVLGSAVSGAPMPTPPPVERDPDALVQTGPGLPAWQWTRVDLGWNGPVGRDQVIELTLLSPTVNLLLALLRVALVAALLLLFLRRGRGDDGGGALPRAALAGSAALLLALATSPRDAMADYPGAELLGELARRLTLPPACLPGCVDWSSLDVVLSDTAVALHATVEVVDDGVAVPLPGEAGQWQFAALVVDGADDAPLLRDSAGRPWVALPRGRHRLSLLGPVPAAATFQVGFQLPPRRVTVDAAGFAVAGVRPDGSSERELVFTRRAASTEQHGGATLEPRALTPFFRVERTLRLGLDWQVETVVSRLTPPDRAVALAIPLLPGESVTTDGVRVEEGAVQADIAASAVTYQWSSVLAEAPRIALAAPTTSDWVETWQVAVSPFWHAAFEGIPVVHHQDPEGRWLPRWQPWPGETLTVTLTRPTGVPGQHLTITRSELLLRPSQRLEEATLTFDLRTSQGGPHGVTLPAAVDLQRVTVDGALQPARAEGGAVTVPLTPGEHVLELTWRAARALGPFHTTPQPGLGADSVNARIALELPADRWVLFAGGPRLGPAVLFWGVAVVLVALAVALGRSRYTPLGTLQWLLLGIGLSQVSVAHGLVVVVWLFALAWRQREPPLATAGSFNLVQVLLVILTVSALSLLFDAIRQGLLGTPDMQIAGNGSGAHQLYWFQDRVAGGYPRAWVVSVPLWCYRVLMLGWALWLAFALLGWLRWGYGAFARGGLWRALERRRDAAAAAPAAESASATAAPADGDG